MHAELCGHSLVALPNRASSYSCACRTLHNSRGSYLHSFDVNGTLYNGSSLFIGE